MTLQKIIKDFYTKNPKVNLLQLDLGDDQILKKIKWLRGYKKAEKLDAIQQLIKIKRLLRLHPQGVSDDKGALLNATQIIKRFQSFGSYHSAHHITRLSEAHFVAEMEDRFGGEAITRSIYQQAAGVTNNVSNLTAAIHNMTSRHTTAMAVSPVHEDTVAHYKEVPGYQDLFGSLDYCDCEACKSVLSPAAYFVDLMNIIHKYVTMPNQATIAADMIFDFRRPDLAQLALTCENTNQPLAYLDIINQHLETVMQRYLNIEEDITLYRSIASDVYPFNIPFMLSLSTLRLYLDRLDTSLLSIYQAFQKTGYPIRKELLKMSQETWALLESANTDSATLATYYGLPDTTELHHLYLFSQQTDLSIAEIKDLLYQNLAPSELDAGLNSLFFINAGLAEPMTVAGEDGVNVIQNMSAEAMDQTHRFIRLARHLKWTFEELDWALHLLDKNITPELDASLLEKLADFQELMSIYQTDTLTSLALIGDLKTYGMANGPSPFDQIFNNSTDTIYHPKNNTNSPYYYNPTFSETPWSWDPTSDDLTNQNYATRIAGSLGIPTDQLYLLANYLFSHNPILVTVGILSSFYRHTLLANLLELPMNQYILLWKLSNAYPVPSPNTIQLKTLYNNALKIKQSGLSVFDLDYINNAVVSPTVDILYLPELVPAWLESLPVLVNSSATDPTEVSIEMETKLYQEIASFFGTSADFATVILNLSCSNPIDVFLGSDPQAAQSAINYFSRWLVATKKLDWSVAVLQNVLAYPLAYSINSTTNIGFIETFKINALQQMIFSFGDVNDRFVNFIAAIKNNNQSSAVNYLADATTWPAEDINTLLDQFVYSDLVNRLDILQGIFQLMDQTGMDLPTLQALDDLSGNISRTHYTYDSYNTPYAYNQFQAGVNLTYEAIKAKYNTGSNWANLQVQLDGEVGSIKRDALMGACIHVLRSNPDTPYIETPRNLYEYLLTDVEMGDEAQISLIKEGLNACQLYLTRCRSHLEPGVEIFEIPDSWWDWMSNYRLWEANRKVFLYPENYLDPAFRHSKTSLFEQLENDLHQNEINDSNVQKAYTNYMKQFTELAQLVPVDAYSCPNPNDPDQDNDLYLFARTVTDPYTYYYMVQENGINWTEWKKIDQTIPVEQVSPIYVFNKLFLFWVETSDIDKGQDEAQITKATIKYTFYDFQGNWIQPQTLVSDQVIAAQPSTFQGSVNSLLADDYFDTSKLCWNKVYPLKIEQGKYWTLLGKENKFEQIAIFYGPMVDTDSKPDIIDVSQLNQSSSTDSDVKAFEDQLNQVVLNFNYLKQLGYSGQVPIFKPLILDNRLNIGSLVNPEEFLFLKNDDQQSDQLYKAQLNLTAGQLNLISTDQTIYDNYIADQALPPGTPNADMEESQILSQDLRNHLFEIFTVKNSAGQFIFKGDQEAFLMNPSLSEPIYLSNNLFNANTLFFPNSFIVDGAGGINEQSSQSVYDALIEANYLDANGRLQSTADVAGIYSLLNDFFVDSGYTEKHIREVIDVLANMPLFDGTSFISSTVSSSESIAYFENLQILHCLDKNGRLIYDLTFDAAQSHVSTFCQNNTDPEGATWSVLNTLYKGYYPSSIGFFNDRTTSPGDYTFQTNRLTTAAVYDLNEKLFAEGIDELLSLESQLTPVESVLPFQRFGFNESTVIPPDAADGCQVDYAGAFGLYYWEVFFHAPMYIADVLKTNQRFEEAEKWYKYIFDPTANAYLIQNFSFETSTIDRMKSIDIWGYLKTLGYIDSEGNVTTHYNQSTDLSFVLQQLHLTADQLQSVDIVMQNHQASNEASQVWQFRPFRNYQIGSLESNITNSQQIAAYNQDPFDPHAIAQLRIGAYEKAVVMAYVDNLIKWGDSYFARNNWESLTMATMRYVYAYDLLGQKPESLGACTTTSATNFEAIQAEYGDDIPPFKISLEDSVSTEGSAIFFQPYNNLDSYFCVPENEKLEGIWDTVIDRLYKIRNSMDINGVKRALPLFQPAIDPAMLARAVATGGNPVQLLTYQSMVPLYRFSLMIERAKGLAANLSQLGNGLLTAIERKDEATLLRLRATQQNNILNLTTFIKEQQIEETNASLAALNENLLSAEHRVAYYKAQCQLDISRPESIALELIEDASILELAAVGVHGVSIAAYLFPNTFGLANGGMQFGETINAAASVLHTSSSVLNQAANQLSTIAQYRRRKEEWELQQGIAEYEVAAIKDQIAGAEARLAINQQDLLIHNKTIKQEEAYEDFLKERFTNSSFYSWMVSRISEVYYQSYQLTLDIALATQAAYNIELDQDAQFIQFNYWDDMRKGLLAGEGLSLALNQMEAAYLTNNSRLLEIEKTISLLQLNPQKFIEFKTGLNGATKGQLDFQLTEALFDFDFPGHYARKIKSISISIPAVVGPYQNINATLRQTSSTIVIQPNIDAVMFANDPINHPNPPDGSVRSNWILNQKIALSKGMDDAGLFVLNFDDGRYLPFEETGAVSSWTLSLPPETNHFDFNSISDIIIKVNYTAKESLTLGQEVRTYLLGQSAPYPFGVAKQFVLQQAFSSAWTQMMQEPLVSYPKKKKSRKKQSKIAVAESTDPSITQQISFPLTDAIILPNLESVTLQSAAVFLQTKDNLAITSSVFLTIQFGSSGSNIFFFMENSFGKVNLDKSFEEEEVTIKFNINNTPTSLLTEDGQQLDPEQLQGMVFILGYTSNVFGS